MGRHCSWALLASLLLAVAACATREPLSPSQREEFEQPLQCKGAEACSKLWRLAQIWVAENAGYKIQLATDAVIETYNATSYSTRWAMRVVRIPKVGDVEQIELTPSCGDAPICGVSAEKLIIRFKRALRQG